MKAPSGYRKKIEAVGVWARPGMSVVFRAEIMPGASREERTFRIERVLDNGRVLLNDFPGEYREGAFEPHNFLRQKNP
jgi:hypothetical protein